MPKTQAKKRGRPRKVAQEKIRKPIKQAIEESLDLQSLTDNWEDEGGSVLPIDEDDVPKLLEEILQPQIILTPNMLFRKKQWDSLDEFSRKRMRMTEEEFLSAEDVTGFGPNSYFTPREER